MSNRYARILAAGGAAVLAATLGVTPALAATTWTIQPGGAITATSDPVTFKDTKTGTVFKCGYRSSTASGTLGSGSGLPGADAGSLSAVGIGHCTGPGGPQFTAQAGGLPWHVNFSSYNVADGVVRGTISHIRIKATAGCTFVIASTSAAARDGRVAFRYTDSTGQLTVLTTGGNLHWYDVGGECLGLFDNGDPATLSATYAVSPKQAITRP